MVKGVGTPRLRTGPWVRTRSVSNRREQREDDREQGVGNLIAHAAQIQLVQREPSFSEDAPMELESGSVPLNDNFEEDDDERQFPVGPTLTSGDPEQLIE
jgi:hypothetical protein